MDDKKNGSQTVTADSQADSYQSPNNANLPDTDIKDNFPEELLSEESSSDDSLVSLKSEWIKVFLEPTLTLAQLNDLKEQLQQSLGHRIQLCGAKVERVDTAALQLLLVFTNSPLVTVGWVEPSQELRDVASLLGLSFLINLPITEQS